MTTATLKLALQKKGRLADSSLELLSHCGIRISATGKLISQAQGFELEALFLRDDDIPQYVADGVADIGIVGENEVAEKGRDVHTVQPLGFGKCRLSLAIREGIAYTGLSYFQGKRIATSYTRILQQWLDAQGLEAEIHEISGSVEIAPSVGMADAIFDIVSTGSTLLMNGLKEVHTVMQSQAVLIAKPNLPAEKQSLLQKLCFRLEAVGNARHARYILLNAPNENLPAIIRILPGMRSPTVLPLAQEGWSSVHAAITEEDFWAVIDDLKGAGAEGILVVPVEKMIR